MPRPLMFHGKFKAAIEHRWAVASVFNLLLSSHNLLTNYE